MWLFAGLKWILANKFSICQQIYSRRFAETWDIAPKPMGSFLFPHTNRSFAAKTLPKMVKSIPPGRHGHGGQAEGRYRDQCQTGRAFLGSCTLLVSIEAMQSTKQNCGCISKVGDSTMISQFYTVFHHMASSEIPKLSIL